MSNFELIDEYLTDRLSDSQRSEFEANMSSDPALQSEVERQSVIVNGIRKARVAELKAMLNNVPIGSTSIWGDNAILKIAATVGVAGFIGTAMYFYSKDVSSPIQTVPSAEIRIDSLEPKEESVEPTIEKVEEINKKIDEGSNSQLRITKPKKIEAKSPKVEVVDPSDEMLPDEGDNLETLVTPNLGISVSTIQVERDSQNKEYPFNYQFVNKKLFLFGPFDESLYEILEVHGDHHALFLYFNDNFYHLNESNVAVTALTPIRDRPLIQKLKEFRSGK